jgi:carboxynorspermidine decarboxylase
MGTSPFVHRLGVATDSSGGLAELIKEGSAQMKGFKEAATMSLSKQEIESLRLQTPAFVYDEGAILHTLRRLRELAMVSGCRVLYSLKAFAMTDALRLMIPMLDGLATSSLFEASLARTLIGKNEKTVHVTTPALKDGEVDDLAELCDYISFNSLSQWNRFKDRVTHRASCGLRVNPQLSYVSDERYDPCRPYSKLGIPISQLVDLHANDKEQFRQVRGLHFHTNCESLDFDPLLATTVHLQAHLGKALKELEWINLGGGYQYNEIDALEPFYRTVDLLKRQFGLDVFVEPGEAIVGNAGYLVSSVVDLFSSEGKTIAMLDTTVNHLPGVFSYKSDPIVLNSVRSGSFAYLLGGATCLAGDLFGEHKFAEPLAIGSKIIFQCVGGYSLVKANMFNGVNLPNIYSLSVERELSLKRRYSIKDFLSKLESTS